uniref:Farnesyl pyrophosphate synthase-like n=1 Tax=Diabrotica virgifera virgifera TaxID=50390 RepID=A0A6P7GY07_DIAVI
MLKTILKNMCLKRTKLARFSSQNTNNINNVSENSAFQTQCKPVDLSFETKKMYAAFPSICEEIVDEQLIYHQAYPELRERYFNLLEYTVNIDQPRNIGKGIFFVHSYRMLEKPSILTDDNLKKACVLGWCQRMVDVSVIIDDDVFDVSDWRYNKPTWHSLKCVGQNKAILDAAFVESSVWYLLIKQFKSHKYFPDILKQVLMSYAVTQTSQCLELTKYDVKDLDKYTYSVRGYGFAAPLLRTALYLANIEDKDAHEFSEKITNDMSHFIKCEVRFF